MALVRAIVLARMRKALRDGLSASKFLTQMRAEGLSYRRTDMLADWRSVNQIEVKDNLIRFVRKDYYPTEKSIAAVTFTFSKEYMYKVKCQTRISPDAPITERFVNIMSDTPMTPAMIEQEAWERSFGQSPPKPLEEREFIAWTALRRVEE